MAIDLVEDPAGLLRRLRLDEEHAYLVVPDLRPQRTQVGAALDDLTEREQSVLTVKRNQLTLVDCQIPDVLAGATIGRRKSAHQLSQWFELNGALRHQH